MDNSTIGLSPQDRDLAIRTVLGEAGDQGDDGMLGVANVILNRQAAGGYGNTIAQIVTAPKQFEPWQSKRAQLLGYSPNDPAYQRAGQIVDDAASGQAPDNTGGATDFYSPSAQAALGRPTPSWAQQSQPTAQIGAHVFFATKGPVQRQTMASNPNPDDVFAELTANAKGNAPAAGVGTAAAPQPSQSSAGPRAASPAPATMPDASPASVDAVFGELTAHAAQNVRAVPPASGTTAPTTNLGATPPAQAGANPQNTGDASAAVGRAVLNGVPIVGPYILSGAEHAAALARMASFGGSYDEALQHVQQFGSNTAAQHPDATLAGTALGATAATLPLMAAAPAAFGIGASSGLGAAAAGAGTGAVIGGADAAVRSGGSPYQTMQGAGIGAAVGALGPVIGQGIDTGANKLMSLVGDIGATARDGISASSRNLLLDAINRDGPQAIKDQLGQLGPDAMLADTGSAVQGLAQGTAVRPNGSALIQAIKDRATGANARIRDAVAGLGPAEDPQTVTDNILALRSQVDSQNYGQALGGAPPVDVAHVVSTIDDHLQTAVGMQRRALEGIRSELVQQGANGRPLPIEDAQILHNVKGEIDNVIQHDAPGLGVPAGAVNRAQGSLQLIRQQLNGALEDQVPGYAEANAASAALARRADAVQAGVDTLSSGKTAPTPQRFVDQFNALPPGEQIAQAKGLLGEVNRLTGTKANDLGAMRTALQGEEGWNTAKMGRVLGDEPVNALMDAVNREGQFGGTYNKVVGNAQTAFRNQSSASLDRQSPFGLNVDVSNVSTPGLVLGTLKNAVYNPLIRFLSATDTGTRDAELARILSAQGPARDAFVNKLFQAAGYRAGVPAWAGALGNAGNALTSASQEPYRLAR